jgi:hypothetical protein
MSHDEDGNPYTDHLLVDGRCVRHPDEPKVWCLECRVAHPELRQQVPNDQLGRLRTSEGTPPETFVDFVRTSD